MHPEPCAVHLLLFSAFGSTEILPGRNRNSQFKQPLALRTMRYALCPMFTLSTFHLSPLTFDLSPLSFHLWPSTFILSPLTFDLCSMPSALCPSFRKPQSEIRNRDISPSRPSSLLLRILLQAQRSSRTAGPLFLPPSFKTSMPCAMSLVPFAFHL